MANSKQKSKFSENKLFWMSTLALLMSLAALVLITGYIQQRYYIEKAASESQMKFNFDSTRLQMCYENDIKPCNEDTVREFNQKTYGQ